MVNEPLRDVLAVLAVHRRPVNVERLVELVIRALTAENQVADVYRSHTVYRDRVAVTVVDVDADRWRLQVLREPWSAPA